MKPFTKQQLYLIEHGKMLTQKLTGEVEEALGIKKIKVGTKRHYYIFSPPGAGKTFTVDNAAKNHNVDLLKIQGASSLNALAIKLAVANYMTNGHLIVWIDDCDTLFMDVEGLNVMKGVLDEDRNVFAWNKNMTTQIRMYENSEGEHERQFAQALRQILCSCRMWREQTFHGQPQEVHQILSDTDPEAERSSTRYLPISD